VGSLLFGSRCLSFLGSFFYVPVSYEGDDYNHIYITIFRDGETSVGCADFLNYDALPVLP
jgi:hypothetical protein